MPLTLTVRMKAVTVSLLALWVSGCVQSELNVSPAKTPSWKKTPDMKVASVSRVAPPKILPETYFSAGRLYESQGSLDKAMVQYRKAVAANHQYVDAYHRLALLQSRTGQHVRASKTFARAVQINPNDPVLRNNYGYELLLTKRWTDATQQFQRVIGLKPDFKRAHINLGIVQSRVGMYEESLASFRKVLQEPDAYYNLGLMHRAQGRYQLAAGCFNHVLTLNSSFAAAKTQLSELAPILKISEKPPVDPIIEEIFAGSCDAPDQSGELFVSVNVDPVSKVTWSQAELLSYADLTDRTFGFDNTTCDSTDDGGIALFALTQDIMSTPDWEDHPSAWDSVTTGNFSMSFREDQFKLTDFLSIMDNEFRCHEEMESMQWNQEVITELQTPRPTLSATVIEGPPARQDQRVPAIETPGPINDHTNRAPQHPKSDNKYQSRKIDKKKTHKRISKPRASLDSDKSMRPVSRPVTPVRRTTTRTTMFATANRAIAIHDSAQTRKLNKIAHGPTWALHTMTAGGSLILDAADETTRFMYGSSTPHEGLTVVKQRRITLPYRIVGSRTVQSVTQPKKAHPASASLATLRDLSAQLEVVQNEIHCLDDESSTSTFER